MEGLNLQELELDALRLLAVLRDGDYHRHNDLVTFVSNDRHLRIVLRTLIDMKELDMTMVDSELVYRVK